MQKAAKMIVGNLLCEEQPLRSTIIPQRINEALSDEESSEEEGFDIWDDCMTEGKIIDQRQYVTIEKEMANFYE